MDHGKPPIEQAPVAIGEYVDGTPVSIVSMSATFERLCIVTDRGTARCIGYEDDGGAFGYPNVANVSPSNAPYWTSIDVVGDLELSAAPDSFSVRRIFDGDDKLCALGRDGRLKCWGKTAWLGPAVALDNKYIGDDEPPSAVDFVALTEVAQVSARSTTTCAITSFDKALRCWGLNTFGELGNGSTTGRLTPNPVLNDVTGVATTGLSTCAVNGVGGIRCWGMNTHGQLGTGSTQQWGHASGKTAYTATAVGLTGPAVTVAAGSEHFCAVLRNGAIACWGANDAGQLGIGSTEDFGDDSDETVPKLIDFGRPP